MKLDNRSKQLLICLAMSMIVFLSQTTCVTLRKAETEEKAVMGGSRNKAAVGAQGGTELSSHIQTHVQAQVVPSFNATNSTLSHRMFKALNATYATQDIHTFKTQNRKWIDSKMNDKQLELIYQDLMYTEDGALTPRAAKSAIEIFVQQFETCDTDKDNVLNMTEFVGCFKNDTYVIKLVVPA
jgi:hypothetical protein